MTSRFEVDRSVLELAYRALDDAKTEIEEFENSNDWYTASQKMMDRIEKAMREIQGIIKP